MHSSAQPFAARTIVSASTSAPAPACSRGTSTTTWCTDASASPPNSCRSSATIANSGASFRSARASSSISAGVACRPAKTPKLTRTSMPGSSCSRTRSEMAGSSTSGFMPCPFSGAANSLTSVRLPAEPERREGQARDAPGAEDGECSGLRPEPLPVQVNGVHQLDEVLERQHVPDRAEEGGVVARGAERARQERHRQKDEVDDRRRSLRRADHRGRRRAERCEGGGADHDRGDERADVRGERRAVEGAPDPEQHDRLQREDDQRRDEERADIGRGRERSRTEPLEDPVLPPDDELDRKSRERGVRAAVADQSGEERLRRRHAVDLPGVDRGEQDVQQQREEEDEERRLAAPPEDELLGAELVHEEPPGRAAPRYADRLGAHGSTSAASASAVSAR